MIAAVSARADLWFNRAGMDRSSVVSPELAVLARVAGVETSYVGWRGQPVAAGTDALLAALRALGHDVRNPDDASAALAAAERAHWAERAPPVVVAWDGGPVDLPVRHAADVDAAWHLALETETGLRAEASGRLFAAPAEGHAWPRALGGAVHCLRRIAVEIPARELGYHRLHWQVGDQQGETTVIAAPTVAFGAPGTVPRRWGVFAPLYAVRTATSGHTGDLSLLRRLLEHVQSLGGSYVATLPLLAAFLDEPCNFSPYSPASRLFWNELYAALADDHAAGGHAQHDHAAPRPADPGALVDYRAQYAWRRRRLDAEAARAWADPAARAALETAATGPLLDYAVFRAIGETERTSWPSWPAHWRDLPPITTLAAVPTGVDLSRVRFHLWAQSHLHDQLAALKRDFGARGGLYLDLPVGVNRDAYEVWRHRDRFLLDLSAGAPPDALFLGGQDWGLPPVHPTAERAAGYRYLRASYAAHMQHASMLRIDHAMGLYRLYCVPRGFAATDGVYLRYRSDEQYAIATLESHRHQCAVVGEDLGTVPPEVRPAMRRHGIASLYVGQFAMPSSPGGTMAAPNPAEVASLNTHDTPTFAGWWRGVDTDDRRALSLITPTQEVAERRERAASRAALLATAGAPPTDDPSDAACARAMSSCTQALAASAAHVALVTLEDLWLEPRTQNVPGTTDERPNWRRPWSRTLDDVLTDPALTAALTAVSSHRPAK